MSIKEISERLALSGIQHVVVSATEQDDLLALMVKTRRTLDRANSFIRSGSSGANLVRDINAGMKLIKKLGEIVPALNLETYNDDPAKYMSELKSRIAGATNRKAMNR